MNKFTTLLNQIVDDSGITQTKIAADVGISRTKLNRCLSGQRNLTFQELETLMEYLSLSKRQKEILKVSFLRRNLSKTQLDNFALIDRMFNNITELSKIRHNQIVVSPIENISIENKIVFGKLNVVTTIIRAIRSGCKDDREINITLNLPMKDKVLRFFFIELVFDLKNHYNINHIVPVNIEDSMINEEFNSINIIDSIITLKYFGKEKYHSYYFDAFLLESDFNIFPYYVILNDKALFISRDFKCMRIEHDLELIRYYKKVTSVHRMSSKNLITLKSKFPDYHYQYIFTDSPHQVPDLPGLENCPVYNIKKDMDYHLFEHNGDNRQKNVPVGLEIEKNTYVFVSEEGVVFSFGKRSREYYVVKNTTFVNHVLDFAHNSTINLQIKE